MKKKTPTPNVLQGQMRHSSVSTHVSIYFLVKKKWWHLRRHFIKMTIFHFNGILSINEPFVNLLQCIKVVS